MRKYKKNGKLTKRVRDNVQGLGEGVADALDLPKSKYSYKKKSKYTMTSKGKKHKYTLNGGK